MNMLGYEAQNMKFGMCGWTADPAVSLEKWDNAVGDAYADWLVTETSSADVEYSFPELETDKTTAEDILLDRAQAYLEAGWKKISAAALYEDIEINNNGDDYFIVNYFAPAQYDAGHIPGAVRFQPKESLHSDNMLKYLPTDKKIVVYCFTGQTSSQIVSYLNSIGYDAYSLLYGVNGMCFSNGAICTTRYHAPDSNYPVVSG
ncbi:MAG: rhodanese-like domain-containing protein [Gemmatimonadetes bacterium]|nr:rhodanese-like domain-containing protein [Gemmatimonadota bacterium]